MRDLRAQGGFTLTEVLVTVVIFSTVATAMYMAMFAGRGGAITARDVARVSQEARLGFNRMVRDTRQALVFHTATSTSYTIDVDFDGNPEDVDVDEYEHVTYTYRACPEDATRNCITISNNDDADFETLIFDVEAIAGEDVFSYSSNLLEYDTLPSPPAGPDGVTTFTELDLARANGASLLPSNLSYVSHVTYSFRVSSGDSSSIFYTQAQVRNFRGGS